MNIPSTRNNFTLWQLVNLNRCTINEAEAFAAKMVLSGKWTQEAPYLYSPATAGMLRVHQTRLSVRDRIRGKAFAKDVDELIRNKGRRVNRSKA